MVLVKTRQVGNSLSVTIPKEFNIQIGQEYNVYKGSDGTLLFSPNKENLIEEATDHLIREKMIDELGKTIDKSLGEIEAGQYVTIEELENDLLG